GVCESAPREEEEREHRQREAYLIRNPRESLLNHRIAGHERGADMQRRVATILDRLRDRIERARLADGARAVAIELVDAARASRGPGNRRFAVRGDRDV